MGRRDQICLVSAGCPMWGVFYPGSVNSGCLFFYLQVERKAQELLTLLNCSFRVPGRMGFAIKPVSLNLEILFQILLLTEVGEPCQMEETLPLQGRAK